MGASSDNWLDKYAPAPADATAARPTPQALPTPAGLVPIAKQTFAGFLNQLLNPVAWGAQAHTDMNAGRYGHAMLGLLGVVPGEGEAAGLLKGFIPAGESIAREGAAEAQALAAAHMANTAEAAPLRTIVKPPTPPAGAATTPSYMDGLDPSLFTRKAPYVPPAKVPVPGKRQPFVGPL